MVVSMPIQFSDIPSTTILLESSVLEGLEHSFALRIIQESTNIIREQLRGCSAPDSIDWDSELERVKQRMQRKRYQRVINATGIVIHTNLGRAPISEEALEYAKEMASGYSDLEMMIQSGKRGGRILGIREKLRMLTGAEDALAVNNNAAAIFLVLTALCKGKEVIISRGELVEIGGSFRVPDVIENGGAILMEVGTTNRTRISDYQNAIKEQTGAVLKVHPSNFSISGFVEKTPRSALAELAQKEGVLFVEDLGSGLLHVESTLAPNIILEESVSKAIADGVDILTFSGDKLLGGAQAGIIIGRKDLIETCRKHPMYRALRLGKISLALLEASLQIHLEGRADSLPVWKMMHRSLSEITEMAEEIAKEFPEARVESMDSYSGGGALPSQVIPSVGICIHTKKAEAMSRHLRLQNPPILARIHQEELVLDPRTLFPKDIPFVLQGLRSWYQS
jgi:L-seryl-tRNA(Ser) seleniumtransferase